ncbi:MAG TPA: ribosome maturation factor RimM [Acidobacteriota bacterium]|nr:ribosome maturation factor RimM [Acidobacteriota bacterium]
MAPDVQSSFITIARIARTRGNRGEVLADLYTDFPDRFSQLREVWLVSNEGTQRKQMILEETWKHKGRIVLKFAGVDSISDAEPFAGFWVEIPAEQAMPLPEGSYFDHDLVGCAVEDLSGNRIGIVSEVLHFAGESQLVVKNQNRESLVPAVEKICVKISIKEKQIVIDPPEGLLDLDK